MVSSDIMLKKYLISASNVEKAEYIHRRRSDLKKKAVTNIMFFQFCRLKKNRFLSKTMCLSATEVLCCSSN